MNFLIDGNIAQAMLDWFTTKPLPFREVGAFIQALQRLQPAPEMGAPSATDPPPAPGNGALPPV